jgi:hypothetical protein
MEQKQRGRAIDLLPARFWSKVQKTPTCWLWSGGTTKGYGRVWWQGRVASAHRLAYESIVGIVPDGYELDHVCRNRHCVRPEHLKAVDHRTNVVLGTGPSAINHAKVCCPKGHPYTIESRGNRRTSLQRRCLVCRREQANAREFAKRKATRQAKWAQLWGEKLPSAT